MDMVRLDSPPELTMPIGEAMFSQRATRRLDPDRPVSDAQLQIILNAASKAPSGGNTQPARCLVIRDRDAICEFGKLYFEAWWAKRRDAYGWTSKADIPEDSVYRLPALLADEMVNAPTIILVYSEQSGVAASSTFPGVQNLLLAARSMGLGASLITLPLWNLTSARRVLKLPTSVTPCCVVPLGWPQGRYGPTTRRPVDEVVHLDSYGNRTWFGPK